MRKMYSIATILLSFMYSEVEIEGFSFVGDFGDNKYYISNSTDGWNSAKVDCENNGGHLVVITSESENNFVHANYPSGRPNLWLGMTDENQEGNWEWVTGEPMVYEYWETWPGGGSPNGGSNENYGAMNGGDGSWDDRSEGGSRYYILEIENEDYFGCTNPGACNYDSSAYEDDGSCEYFDCSGECGGPNLNDNCGTCDSDTSNDCVQDCAGTWGGDLVLDDCGGCGGSDYFTDGLLPDGSCDCDGNILDCSDECGGDDVLDECGICDNDSSNDCVQDCGEVWGGTATVDDCGSCSSDISDSNIILLNMCGCGTASYTNNGIKLTSPEGIAECYYNGSAGNLDLSNCSIDVQGDFGDGTDPELVASFIHDNINANSQHFSSEMLTSQILKISVNDDVVNASSSELSISNWEEYDGLFEINNGSYTSSIMFSDSEDDYECIQACDDGFYENWYGYGTNPLFDDCGVCDGENECYGCLDPLAMNYSAIAELEDGSCEYSFWYVPVNIGSISSAMSSAQDGDTILVSPGTYIDQIDFQGKAVTLISRDGPENTFLLEQQDPSVIFYDPFDVNGAESNQDQTLGNWFFNRSHLCNNGDCSGSISNGVMTLQAVSSRNSQIASPIMNFTESFGDIKISFRYRILDGGGSLQFFSRSPGNDILDNNTNSGWNSIWSSSGNSDWQTVEIDNFDPLLFFNDNWDGETSSKQFMFWWAANSSNSTTRRVEIDDFKIEYVNEDSRTSRSVSNLISFDNNENFDSKISGFTINSGNYVTAQNRAIFIKNASPTIQNMIFSDRTYSFLDPYGGSSEDWIFGQAGQNDFHGPLIYLDNSNAMLSDIFISNQILIMPSISGMSLSGSGPIYITGGHPQFDNLNISEAGFVAAQENTSDGSAEGFFGSAIYIEHGSATFSNSSFINNYTSESYSNKAPIYIRLYYEDLTQEEFDINFSNCVFDGNYTTFNYYSESTYGGAVSFESFDSNISSTLSFDGCSFQNNYVETIAGNDQYMHSRGGALYVDNLSVLNIENSTFSNNSAIGGKGGAIYAEDVVSINIVDTYFEENQALSYNTQSINYYGYGGSIYMSDIVNMSLNNIYFNGNQSKKGGGLYLTNSNSFMNNVFFSDNYASEEGGGMYLYGGAHSFNNSEFRRNSANYGGGIYETNSHTLTMQKVVVADNDAEYQAGGMYFNSGDPVISHCTLVNNWSQFQGSGMYCNSGVYPVYLNSIIWGNSSSDGAQIYLSSGSEIIINNSDVQSGSSGIIGFDDIILNNIISEDPQFVDSDNEDYHLVVTSPCIDTGNPASAYDADGTIADMGAYSFDQNSEIPGCMDENAQNYYPDANVNVGCVYGPGFISIYDVPEDQGGYVFLNFNANSLDLLPNPMITSYSAWRYVPNNRGWEYLGETPASFMGEYTFTAPTIEISVPNDDEFYYTSYKIRAHTDNPVVFYDTAIDSGYSVDNIAPSAPASFTSNRSQNTISLSWDEVAVQDLSYYTVYEGTDQIAQTTSPTFEYSPQFGEEYYYYFVTATDIHGNISQASDADDVIGAILGDLNLDLEINVMDIVISINIILEYIEAEEYQQFTSDINGDMILNILDLVSHINLILGEDLARGNSLSSATLNIADNQVELSCKGHVAGIQINFSNEIVILNDYLPQDWKLDSNGKTVLIYNLDGAILTSELLFEYEGDSSIESAIVVDWYENSLSPTIQIIPETFSLNRAYPNPFNPVTNIEFAIPVNANVLLEVYGLDGRKINTLEDRFFEKGYHSIVWDASNYPSGMYFVKMVSNDYIHTQKLMLIK